MLDQYGDRVHDIIMISDSMCYSCSMSGCATAVIKPNNTLTAVANPDISHVKSLLKSTEKC